MVDKVEGFYEKIVGDSGTLQDLLSKIPGLSGYMERGRRREADQLLRDTITGRLEQVRLKYSAVFQTVSRDIFLAMDYAERMGRADNLLMGLIGKIKDAPVGYAGFFSAISVDAEDLARLYSFDELMLNHTDQIQAEVDALTKAAADGGDLNEPLNALTTSLTEANTTFNSRQEVLNGIK
ncbi:MAG: hypothetical protein KJ046_15740 [Anaerolineae bacterium]|nr:hypothetical protein [Anaerolineae bacterium]RIK19068.1 MAG: hypothetical protein DCC51_09515 [Anaerolineae bacterium]